MSKSGRKRNEQLKLVIVVEGLRQNAMKEGQLVAPVRKGKFNVAIGTLLQNSKCIEI